MRVEAIVFTSVGEVYLFGVLPSRRTSRRTSLWKFEALQPLCVCPFWFCRAARLLRGFFCKELFRRWPCSQPWCGGLCSTPRRSTFYCAGARSAADMHAQATRTGWHCCCTRPQGACNYTGANVTASMWPRSGVTAMSPCRVTILLADPAALRAQALR